MTTTILAAGGPGPLSLFLTQLLGFLAVAAILRFFVWNHLKAFLAGRTTRIEKSVNQAEEDREAAALKIDELEERLRNIEQERKQMIELAEKEARHGRDDLLAQAHQTSRQVVDRSSREIQLEWEKTRIDLRQESVRLTLAVAEKLVDRTMDDETHRALVDRTIDDLGRTPWKD